MPAREKIFDDLARVAGGAVSLVSSMRQQVREEVRARIDEMAMKMDLVPREDFEKLEAMLEQSRLEQEAIKKRLDALEISGKTKRK